jgi:two-component system, chemotaxis family, protein-glutamate methylesterase/glutaminase
MEDSSDLVPSPRRNLVVIGASAGGVEALKKVIGSLPAGLPAAVCVVLHIAPRSPSALAAILDRAGVLPCQAAHDGAELREGHILVAQPDRHLVIEDSRVRLTMGPRQNNHRPAIDALFRSAAEARGPAVIGVVLSGTRDDGTAGLAVIKGCGGAAVVQDPDDALYPGMPASAIAHVAVDAVVPSHRIAETLSELLGQSRPAPRTPAGPASGPDPNPHITICPECGGVLSEHEEAGTRQWSCRVGHLYSPETLVDAQAGDVEAALWTAIRALEDQAILLGNMSEHLQESGLRGSSERFRHRANAAADRAGLVRSALAHVTPAALAMERDELSAHEQESRA